MKSAHFWVVMLLLAGAGLLLHVRGNKDREPASAPLDGFPEKIGMWTGRDLPIDAAVLEVLGKGFFLNRVYIAEHAAEPKLPGTRSAGSFPAESTLDRVQAGESSPGEMPVMLFIAYFPTQRTGQAIHSPQNCLPGSGWTFESSGVTDLADSTGHRYQVGEYLISDGRMRQEVLYWYRSHGRSIANDYKAKLYTLADSIRYNRTDAALIRVVTPVAAGGDRYQAHQRAVRFAEQMVPLLPPYIPD